MKLRTFALASALALAPLSPARADPLVDVAQRYLGARNFTGLRAPWCTAALRIWLARAGYRAPRSNRAVDFAQYGRPARPQVRAIAVMRHHVGIVIGFSRHGPILLSGNHRHRVGVGVYPARRIIAYRVPF